MGCGRRHIDRENDQYRLQNLQNKMQGKKTKFLKDHCTGIMVEISVADGNNRHNE